MLRHNVKNYVERFDVYLASKSVRHEPYRDLQSFLLLTNCWKELLIDFAINLSILINLKDETYN